MADGMNRKDLLDIESLSQEELLFLLDNATPFKDLFTRSVKKVPTLRGKTVLNLFYEPSTRTRTSFEIAAKRLSADVQNFAVSTSSVVKGESIQDTIDTLMSMKVDYIVVRHGSSGVPKLIADYAGASVVNAGDGFHAHPTQALLDAYTLREVYPELAGRKVLIMGDILHSRVARSVARCFHMLGVEVAMFGPGTLIPQHLPDFITRFDRYEEAWAWGPDAIYLLRVQNERMKDHFFPTTREYHQIYGINRERFAAVRETGTWIMHPGPVNRGVEVTDEVMSYERSLINQQVENGIAVRMSVLYALKPQTEAREGSA